MVRTVQSLRHDADCPIVLHCPIKVMLDETIRNDHF